MIMKDYGPENETVIEPSARKSRIPGRPGLPIRQGCARRVPATALGRKCNVLVVMYTPLYITI